MSLDFSLERVQPTEVFSGNMTHNVTPMWKKAGVYDALYNAKGKKAEDVLPILKAGIDYFVANKDSLEKLNPSNGWGSYETALTYLIEVRDACEEYPDSIIRISK